jgi:hypothetical protein
MNYLGSRRSVVNQPPQMCPGRLPKPAVKGKGAQRLTACFRRGPPPESHPKRRTVSAAPLRWSRLPTQPGHDFGPDLRIDRSRDQVGIVCKGMQACLPPQDMRHVL